ncbi:MAG TPA: sigma-70 family RNA polymerase sigma factor [Planctomycetota bacterium]|nr:sigma-70 family RNA polymerase sigma factor [Planctomycetota bacterium]
MPRPDAELMLEFQQTDNEEAFAELVGRYQKPLVNFFYRLVWDEQQSEDLSQEVFCRIFIHRKSYKAQAKFSTYLFRIARNLWIDHYRSHGKMPQFASLSMPAGRDSDEQLIDRLAAPTPCEPAETPSDTALRLQAALDQLSEEQRLVFVLSKNQGMKYAEIAETLSVPVGTVRSRMHSAVQKLQRLLVRPSG